MSSEVSGPLVVFEQPVSSPLGPWYQAHRHVAAIVVVSRFGGVVRAGPMHLRCATECRAEVVRLIEDAPISWHCLDCKRPLAPNLEN